MAHCWKTEIVPLCALLVLAGVKESDSGTIDPKGLEITPQGNRQPGEWGSLGVWVLHKSDSTHTFPGIQRAATCPVWHVLLSAAQI